MTAPPGPSCHQMPRTLCSSCWSRTPLTGPLQLRPLTIGTVRIATDFALYTSVCERWSCKQCESAHRSWTASWHLQLGQVLIWVVLCRLLSCRVVSCWVGLGWVGLGWVELCCFCVLPHRAMLRCVALCDVVVVHVQQVQLCNIRCTCSSSLHTPLVTT